MRAEVQFEVDTVELLGEAIALDYVRVTQLFPGLYLSAECLVVARHM